MAKKSKRKCRPGFTQARHRHRDYFQRSLRSPDALRALGELITRIVNASCLCGVTLFILLSKHPITKAILCVTAASALSKTFSVLSDIGSRHSHN